MARVDLNKHKSAILNAHKDVSNPNGTNNWALYGYEGKTNILKLVETGDGGLEELIDELSSGKIMYAYCRVQDPNTGLPKFVLINWQGEGVPEMRKGSCANHIRDVESLLKGAHMTLMARNEDDLDPDDVLKKVAKSSGSNYSFHKEVAKPAEPIGPVGSNYKRTVPQQEILAEKRESFWEKEQERERQRREEEESRLGAERAQIERERREREAREEQQRNERERERHQRILAQREAEFKAIAPKPQAKDNQSANDALHDAEERSRRSEQMRKERAAEAKALIGGSQKSARNVFEQSRAQFNVPAKSAPPPPRKLKHSFGPQGGDSAAVPQQRKQPIEIPRGEPEIVENTPLQQPEQEDDVAPPAVPRAPVRQRPPSPPPARQPSPPPARQPSPPPARQPSPPPARQPSPPPARQPSPPPTGPQTRNLMAQGLPPRPPSDEEEDEDWGEEESTPVQAPVIAAERAPEPVPEPARPEPTHYEPEPAQPAQPALSTDQGLCAKALFDYQAAEDNEISFDPDDIITHIDRIDDGWWLGTAPSGLKGMFPANFVELINDGADSSGAAEAATTPEAEQSPDNNGLCARALYDYQAEDDNELTFDPGDVITRIEQIDEGWWTGVAPNGKEGLFPANYVELIQ